MTAQAAMIRPAAIRPVKLGPQDVTAEHRADGTILLRSPQPLGAYPDKLTERLEFWAAETPTQIFLAQRDQKNGAWRTITYEQALEFARRIGESLLARNLSAERPIAILSGNDIEHALLALGALYVGIPHAPISPAYSLMSGDFGKLRSIMDLLTPGLVFACDGQTYARALDATLPASVELVVTRNAPANRRATMFSDLYQPAPSAKVDAAHDAVGPDTIAKFLFTSGSTGVPKCVINTQRMWCANQVMIRQSLAYFADEPPVIVDWAPWHHTAGGNHDVGLVVYNGGTFYIDEGKPLPGAIEETVRNLREIAPTWYFTVPKGYEALLPFLRSDADLRRNFFSRLKLFWFAGAGIAQHVFDEIQQLALETCGERILFLTGFGSTETAPCALARTWPHANAANMGLPAAGMELKLVPNEGKLEARVRGPNITPGYWRQPEVHGKGVRRGRLLPARRRLQIRRPQRPAPGPAVRRPHRRGFQAVDRHLGERRPAARALHRSLRALCARRGVRRRRPRRDRRAGVSRHGGLPQIGRAWYRRRARGHRGVPRSAGKVQKLVAIARRHEPRLVDPGGARHLDDGAAVHG